MNTMYNLEGHGEGIEYAWYRKVVTTDRWSIIPV